MPAVKQNENEFPHNSMNLLKGRKGKPAAAVAGMFLLDLIPLLGFPVAFLWAQAKFRSKKLKLTAITAALILLNIIITVFFYAATITLMHNSLAKAAQEQGILDPAYTGPQKSSSDFPSASQPDISVDKPLLIEESGGFIPGMDSNMSGSKPQDMPDGIKIPETDKDGNTYVDTDNDGEFDSYIDSDGNVIPMDSIVDEHGNRYMDYDGNGIYEALIDRDGVMYYDLDGDGKYETKLDAE